MRNVSVDKTMDIAISASGDVFELNATGNVAQRCLGRSKVTVTVPLFYLIRLLSQRSRQG